MLRGEPGAGAEGEREVEAEAEVGGEAGGVPLTEAGMELEGATKL